MGLFGWMFGSANLVAATPEGDATLGRALLDNALRAVCEKGFAKSGISSIITIENDKGFFSDVFNVFNGTMYAELREADPHSFILSVASSSMLGGMYAYFCAKIIQKPLYANYDEVKRRFFDIGPMPCVMNFIQRSWDHNSPEELSYMIDTVVDTVLTEDWSFYCSGDKLKALAKAMYDMGITMGTYFL